MESVRHTGATVLGLSVVDRKLIEEKKASGEISKVSLFQGLRKLISTKKAFVEGIFVCSFHLWFLVNEYELYSYNKVILDNERSSDCYNN
jgi:hypothetical protein